MAAVVFAVPNVAAEVKLNPPCEAEVAGAAVPAGEPNLNPDWPAAGVDPACDWLPKVNGALAPPPPVDAPPPPKLKAPEAGGAGAAPAPNIDFF